MGSNFKYSTFKISTSQLIYTIDNNVPVNTITDDTVVFKLSMDISSLIYLLVLINTLIVFQ